MRATTALASLAATLLLAAAARADVAASLRQGTEAIARRDLEAASAAYRQALEADGASAEQRSRAAAGLLEAAVAADQAPQLLAYIQRRQAAAPAQQQPLLRSAEVRCRKAVDGHLFGAIEAAARRAKADPKDREARRVGQRLRQLCHYIARAAENQARQRRALASRLSRDARYRPGAKSRTRWTRPAVPKPQRPSYSGTPLRLTRTRRRPGRGPVKPLRVPKPRPPYLRPTPAASVTMSHPRRPDARQLAAAFLRGSYARSRRLVARGLADNAKAELATVIKLFPESDQAQEAARYALPIFRQQRGANGRGESLVAYLAWVRAMDGFKGAEQAQYQALKSFSAKTEPAVIAHQAHLFIQRYPKSVYATAVRLQRALALEADGHPDEAIETLKPVADAPESKSRVKALHVLAWLHIFKGEGATARPLLEKVAAQTLAPDAAIAARRLLDELAARPLAKGFRLPAGPADAADELAADRLFDTAERVLRDGDPERAMDVFALYLRLAAKTGDFADRRERIARFKETGKMEEP